MAVSFRECTLEDLEILQAFSRRLFFETFADMNTPENMAVYLDKAFAAEKIRALLSQEEVTVTKKSKNGNTEQNIIPMMVGFSVEQPDGDALVLQARICCQNPSLNPMQIAAAIEKYLPECAPSFVECSRLEIYDQKEQQFR